ncbi:MAG: type II and III secretion system protein family protein [Pseudomonadota bacterium]
MNRIHKQLGTLLRIGLVALILSLSTGATAQDPFSLGLSDPASVRELTLSAGKSQIIRSEASLGQIVVGNPDIADVQLLNQNQFLVLGQTPGTTNLAFHDTDGEVIAMLDVVIGYDLDAIKRNLHDILPDEDRIEVRSANGNVVLSGHAASASSVETILSLVRSYAPEDQILNLMQVGGGQQVMLEARIAEVQRNSLRTLGVGTDAAGSFGSNSDISLITSPTLNETFADLTFNNSTVGDALVMNLQALEREGAARILAEPNIVALSGQEASFLVGGEFPVPIARGTGSTDGAGSITIQFKEYGVGLRFLPTVLSDDRINIQLNTEVSDLDRASGTTVLGTSVPGLRTRRAGTTVELGDGNSFAIAGLLQSGVENVVNEFPGLGNIPILGALFRSTDFQQDETELVIVITPRLVRSANRDDIRLPTEDFTPPTRREQYLEGRTEGAGRDQTQGGDIDGLDGASGHQF